MPSRRTAIRTIKTVLRLKFDSKLSQRNIARSVNISVGAVSTYLKKVAEARTFLAATGGYE